MTRIVPDNQSEVPTEIAPDDTVWTLTLHGSAASGRSTHADTAWSTKSGVQEYHWDTSRDVVEVEEMTMYEFLKRHYEENSAMNPFMKANRIEWLQDYMDVHDPPHYKAGK